MASKDNAESLHGKASIESWLVSAGRERQPGSPLNVPPSPASNFVLGDRRAYSRDDGTPSWEALEEIVGGLEGGSSVLFASGMASIAAIFDQLAAGSVVALSDDCYQAVAGIANVGRDKGRWTLHRVAVADTKRWIEMCGVADLIWLESPSNSSVDGRPTLTRYAQPRENAVQFGRRQYVRYTVKPTPTRSWSGRINAIGNEIHRWPF